MMALLERVVETRHGFNIEGSRHRPITVTFTPTFIQVRAEPENDQVDDRELRELESRRFGFYQYYALSHHIGKCIAADWKRPKRENEEIEPSWLRPWKAKKEITYIGKDVHGAWQNALKRIDQVVLAAHRQVFAACGQQCCDLVMDKGLYQYPHIAMDIGKYRAAAIAAMNIDDLAIQAAQRRQWYTPQAEEIRQQLEDLQRRALAHNLDIRANVDFLNRDLGVDDLEAMANWRGLFSYNGEPYRSLNRTLMNLPGNIPHWLVCNLSGWILEGPYTERLRLLTILLMPDKAVNFHVFGCAQVPQIKEAMKRVAEHTRNELSTRRYRDVKFMVEFLADFPERHTGNVVGLADKAIGWHRAMLQRAREQERLLLADETGVAIPPIPLPETPGVTFLDTVGAIRQEGEDMRHCIASYAQGAVNGRYFLFHIEHNGDSATAQVDFRGHIAQVHGPGNQRNGAVRWGRRALRRWGCEFPELPPLIAPPADLGDELDELPF